jgi:alpha-beta hydrolase superfamily lysophospholipase
MKHYNEADLLETYYTQPGESMPVMMHLAGCTDCAARYARLERKLREAAVCNTEKPATFWTRQRLQIMRRVDAQHAHAKTTARTLRVAAAAILSFFLGGAVVYETVKPVQHQPPPAVAAPSATVAPAPAANNLHDAWQSDELKDFHNVVEWEAWLPDEKTPTNQESSL